MKKNILLIVCAVIIVAVAAVLIFGGNGTSSSSKNITIEVVDDKGASTVYEVKTKAEYLLGALDDAKGLNYSGTDSDYGLMLQEVNGVRAVYEENGAYWGFYLNGEYCVLGLAEQPVTDGDAFKIEYSVF